MRTPRRLLGGAAAALLLLATASGCGGDDDSTSGAVGDLVQGRVGDLAGATSYPVLVPTGELTVQVGPPVDTLTARQAADGTEHEAPAGTHWVGVDWTFAPGADHDPLLRTLMDAPTVETTLSLESAGTSTDLGAAPGTSGTPAATRTAGVVYVAVAADDDPVLQVDFDGVTTQVDTASGDVTGDEVAALAAIPPAQVEDCSLAPTSAGSAEVACTVTLAAVPYLAGRGWSSAGWSVARVETRSDSFVVGGATYDVQEVEDSSVLDQRTAGEGTVVARQRGSLVTQVAVEGAAQVLDVSRTLTGVLSDGDGPDDATLVVSGRVALD